MRLLSLVCAVLLTVPVLLHSPQAMAQAVEFDRTDCDTLSLDPLRVRVEFYVINNDPRGGVCEMLFTPIVDGTVASDTCGIVDVESPSGWAGGPILASGGAQWVVTSGQDPACIGLGETYGPYAMILSSPLCCYHAEFSCPILECGWPVDVCFECDMLVQAMSGTWGRLKTFYR